VSGRAASSPSSIWTVGDSEPGGSIKGVAIPPCRREQCNQSSIVEKGRGLECFEVFES